LEEFDTQFSEIYIDEEDVDVDDYILNKCNSRIKFFIKSSLEEILMSMPIDEVLATGFECDDYNQGCNQKSKEVKEWRDFILK